MELDPAPFISNLFCFTYESKWMLHMGKRNLQKARKFTDTFRFIDDPCAINDNSEFEKNCKEIYWPELVLQTEIFIP